MWSFRRNNRASDDARLSEAEAALDRDPSDLKPFAQIDRVLASRKDWIALEAAYRRMIARLGASSGDDARAMAAKLWHALGEIYRSRLKDYQAALRAYEVSLELDPGGLSDPRHLIVHELRALMR